MMAVSNDTIQESIDDVINILDSAPTPRHLFMGSGPTPIGSD